MSHPKHEQDVKTEGAPLPEGQGESAIRRKALDEGGGSPSPEHLEDNQLRGVDEDGRHTTGTHGGPHKDGTTNPSKEGKKA
jgi:hypothetical protein